MFGLMFLRQSNVRKGFSLIEVLLSISIFAMFVTGLIGAIIYGRESTMLSGARNRAVFLAEEGLEAVRNMRDESFVNLADGTYGLAVNSNQWQLSGTSDTIDSFFTRQIAISTVNSTKKQVASTVIWQQNPQRTGSVSLTTYLTKWQAQRGGIAVYSDTTQTPQDQYRVYNNTANTFTSQSQITGGSINGRNFVIKTSPIKTEAIAGFTDSTSPATLQIMCYNGTSWTSEWTATVGGTGTTKRFDIAYETNSGDAIVLYSTNTANNNEMAWKAKSGTAGCGTANWSVATNLSSARTNGIVQWVEMAQDRRASSNLIAAIWADQANDLSAMVWSGSAWGNEPSAATETSLETITAGTQDVDDFEVEYESLSGDVLVVWANSAGANGTNGVRYRTCTGGTATCTWNAVTTPPTWSDDAHNMDISANPTNDEIIFASIGDAGDDLQVGRWDGNAWANVANKDQTSQSPASGSKNVASGWLISGTTTRGIVVYHDSVTDGRISYLTMTPGATPTWSATLTANPVPAMGATQRWYEIQMDSFNINTLILTASNSVLNLFAKRLVMDATPTFNWSDANSGSVLEANLGQATANPFGFAYWRDP